MSLNKTLFDPRRTIPAGRLEGIIHATMKVDHHFETYCGKSIEKVDLLILCQRIEDITCMSCQTTYIAERNGWTED